MKQIIKSPFFISRFIRLLCFVGLFILLVEFFSQWFSLGFNITESIPGSVFFIKKSTDDINVNDMVAFWPPENKLYKNHYFVKYVRGVGGDVVTMNGQDFFINDEFVGRVKKVSRSGIRLSALGEGVIPDGYFFMWTPHKYSFDSRYKEIGLIPASSVIGTAHRIF